MVPGLRGHRDGHGAGGPHAHPIGPNADRGRLTAALLLIVGFMVAEVVVGVVAHSLALLSDAGHMLTDAGAIGLSLVALRLAARPPRGGLTYGFRRAEILSALANGATLLVLAALIAYEAVHRLLAPPRVEARLMLGVALAGIVVNVLATWQLARADRRSLNIRGSHQHIVTDLYAFAGTAVAAVVILVAGFDRADPIASLLVVGLMARAGYGLLRDAGRILLEAAPAGLDPAEVTAAVLAHPKVASVHDLHLWEVSSGFPALTAHVLVPPGEDCHAVRRELEHLVGERFGVRHTTLQVDHEREPQLITIEPR